MRRAYKRKFIPTGAYQAFFNDMNQLSLHHLYIYHTFIDTLKILKYIMPISHFKLFKSSSREYLESTVQTTMYNVKCILFCIMYNALTTYCIKHNEDLLALLT